MEQIEALENGLNKYVSLKNIVDDDDIKLNKLRFNKVMEFLDKVQNRMSLNKRYDLFCYKDTDDRTIGEIFPISKATEGYGIVSLFENGLGTRTFKRSKTRMVDLLSTWSRDFSKEVINVLTEPKNEWIYSNIKDETTKLVMSKFLVIAKKYDELIQNRGRDTLYMKFSKKVELPLKYLIVDNYKERNEIGKNTLIKISVNTEYLDRVDFEYRDEEPKTDSGYRECYLPEQIILSNYKQFYLMEQHYDEFVSFMNEYKEQIYRKKEELQRLFGEIDTDVEQLKVDLAHIFVIDSI